MLDERKAILDPIKHLTVVYEVEAQQIQLAADYERITGAIPVGMQTDNKMDATQFDELARKQNAIDKLTSGKIPSHNDLVKMGFSLKKSKQIVKKLSSITSDDMRIDEGKLLLKEHTTKCHPSVYLCVGHHSPLNFSNRQNFLRHLKLKHPMRRM